MDLDFHNQNDILSDEYHHDRIGIAIKSLIIHQNLNYSSKNNFNGFIHLYKDWRIKAIKQLIKKEEKETYGKYFESFIYNWIAFNACYSFYRENSYHMEDSSGNYKNDEGENISRLGDANVQYVKEKIMQLYSYNSFKAVIDLRITGVPSEISKIIHDLKNTAKTYQDYKIDKVAVTYKIYLYVTYRLKRVRNNLFHGKKSDENSEDKRIVEEAAKLLNYFLYQFEVDFLTTIKDRLIE